MIYKGKFGKFLESTFMAFTIAVIFISLIGLSSNEKLLDFSTFYVRGGVSFTALFQIFILASITGFINFVFDSEAMLLKIRALYLGLIKSFLIMMTCILFILVFHWFPNNDINAWISFLITFLTCFGVATLASVFATRKKDKEYEAMLNSYKKTREENHHECNPHG